MSAAHLQALSAEQLAHSREAVKSLVFNGQQYRIEQVVYETNEYMVYELAESIALNGKEESYLALNSDFELYSIDVYAAPKQFLTTCHGQAWVALS